MPFAATEMWSVSATSHWLHGLWEYYREYTHTAVHAASTAALTAFGLLIFVDPLFVVLAIATYVCPPVILYSLDSDVGRPSDPSAASPVQTEGNSDGNSDTDFDSDSDGSDGDTDAGSDDGDSDSDSGDGDSDSDSDGGDSNTDGSDADKNR